MIWALWEISAERQCDHSVLKSTLLPFEAEPQARQQTAKPSEANVCFVTQLDEATVHKMALADCLAEPLCQNQFSNLKICFYDFLRVPPSSCTWICSVFIIIAVTMCNLCRELIICEHRHQWNACCWLVTYPDRLCLCPPPSQDFKEQIVHHVATIALISFSWLVNYIRAGTLIMLVHDSSDYLMEVWHHAGDIVSVRNSTERLCWFQRFVMMQMAES